MKTPLEIVDLMMSKDQFSKLLGIEIVEINQGSCVLKMIVKNEFVNGFQIAHGGITYSFADSALAFAANSYGYKCVSVDTSISHVRAVELDEQLEAQCHEIYRGKKIGVYEVKVLNQNKKLVSLFKGTVHISKNSW